MAARSKIQILLLLIATSAFGLSACHSRPIHKPGSNSEQGSGTEKPEPQPQPEPDSQTEELSWNHVYSKVFEPRCVDCHKGMNTYAGVKKRIADIEFEVFTLESMPEDGPLTAEQSELLKNWIAAGAPEIAPTLIQDAQGNLSFKK